MIKKSIRNGLLLAGSGMLIAFLVVFWIVKVEPYENGVYAKNILLNPLNRETMGSRMVRIGGGELTGYPISSIDYSYFDAVAQRWEMASVDRDAYEGFWKELQEDRGSIKGNEELTALFNDPKVSTLSIYIRKEMLYRDGGLNELYQQVQVPPIGDLYRVEIPEEAPSKKWAYFYHPGIQTTLFQILKKQK